MMRRTIVGVVLATGLMFSAFSSVQASGYPMASIVSDDDSTILLVGRFCDASFSPQLAEAYTAFVAAMIAGHNATTYTPSQLAAMGLGDATALINWLGYGSYYRSMGFDGMMYFNAQRFARYYGKGYDVGVRLDIYVADLYEWSGGAIPGNYVTSVEFPEGFLVLANSL